MKRYQAPRNAAERIAEAKHAIARLNDSLFNPFTSSGEHWRIRDAIERWEAIITKESE